MLLFIAAACPPLFLEGFLHIGRDSNWNIKSPRETYAQLSAWILSWGLKSGLRWALTRKAKGGRQAGRCLLVRRVGPGHLPICEMKKGKPKDVCLPGEKCMADEAAFTASKLCTSGKFWLWETNQCQKAGQWNKIHWEAVQLTYLLTCLRGWRGGREVTGFGEVCALVFNKESGVRANALFVLEDCSLGYGRDFSGCEKCLM